MTEPFDALSRLAILDAEIITLERSRANLPARVAQNELDEALGALDRSLRLVFAERQPLDATVDSLDAEAQRLRLREQELNAALSSATGAGREMAAMDQEVHRLAKNRDELEEQEILVLEALEPIEQRQGALEGEREALLRAGVSLPQDLLLQERELDVALAEHRTQRSEVAGVIEAGLLARYEKIAVNSQGVGAARIEHEHCSGCHLSLAAVELDHLKKMPLDELATCEQCSRLLLRSEQLG